MGKIKKLSAEAIARLAAGEVIERPAYIVKELIENAIDAKATKIIVEVSGLGLESIKVSDNGEGMSKEDLLLSWQMHTTSKVNEQEHSIKTLGFRGEALASIAATSDISIASRVIKSNSGNLLEIMKGKRARLSSIGMPVGTAVTVTSLFTLTPARKKFLKSGQTEYRHIIEVLTQIALSNPNVSFEFLSNRKSVLTLISDSELKHRVKALLGAAFQTELMPVKQEEGYLRINGFISHPQDQTTNTRRLYFTVNGRHITSPLLVSAVRDSYGSLMAPLNYPPVVLSIEIPWERIDINVHPRKEEIRFLEPEIIYKDIKATITEQLLKYNLTFSNVYSWKKSDTNSPFATELKNQVKGVNLNLSIKQAFQVHNSFIVVETEEGLLILDQHAADERVLFEKYLTSFKNAQKNPAVKLTQAQIINLGLTDFALFIEFEEFFKKMGFNFSKLKGEKVKVTKVPYVFKDQNVTGFISEALTDLSLDKLPQETDRKNYLLLSYLACRSAIKAGDKLTNDEVQNLVKNVSSLDTGYTCPHGRPLKVQWSLTALNKLFMRS